MRLRPAVLTGLLLLALAHPAAQAGPAVTTTGFSQPDACGFSYDQPSGDASLVDLGQSQPAAPSQDVTHVAFRLTATAFEVTATVPQLADTPALEGDEWEAQLGDGEQSQPKIITFGYFRSRVQGGGPYLFGPAHLKNASLGDPQARTDESPVVPTHLAATFDVAAHTVRLVLPRADAQALLGRALAGFTFRQFVFSSYTRHTAYTRDSSDNGGLPATAARLNVSVCDKALRTQRRAAAPRCLTVAAAGDEATPVQGLALRPDDADLVGVQTRTGASKVSVVVSMARLTPSAAVGTGVSYAVSLGGKDAMVSRSGGAAVVTGAAGVTAVFDDRNEALVVTFPRAGLPRAAGARVVSSVQLGPAHDAQVDSVTAKAADLRTC